MAEQQWRADEDLLTDNDDGRRGRNARLIAVHTTEGGDTVRGIAEWQQKPSSMSSYHVLIARDGSSIRSNDDAFIPWAAMYSGNRAAYHVALAGKAAQSREDWLSRTDQLNTLADYMRHTARLAAIPLVKVGPDVVKRADGRGVCGHADISQAWRESDHTDPGRQFPWDAVLNLAGAVSNPASPGAARIHVVMPGDTLSSIARQYGTTWQVLAHINSAALSDPDRIRPGLVVRLAP